MVEYQCLSNANYCVPSFPWCHNSEDYATIDNAAVFDDDYEDASCTSASTPVPPGWRLADWDANVAFVSCHNN